MALHTAATDGAVPLLGLDASGVGYRYDPRALHFPSTLGGGASTLNWGPLNLYPRGTFQASRALLAPTPPRESAETLRWPGQYEELAPASASRSASPSRSTRRGGAWTAPPSPRWHPC